MRRHLLYIRLLQSKSDLSKNKQQIMIVQAIKHQGGSMNAWKIIEKAGFTIANHTTSHYRDQKNKNFRGLEGQSQFLEVMLNRFLLVESMEKSGIGNCGDVLTDGFRINNNPYEERNAESGRKYENEIIPVINSAGHIVLEGVNHRYPDGIYENAFKKP